MPLWLFISVWVLLEALGIWAYFSMRATDREEREKLKDDWGAALGEAHVCTERAVTAEKAQAEAEQRLQLQRSATSLAASKPAPEGHALHMREGLERIKARCETLGETTDAHIACADIATKALTGKAWFPPSVRPPDPQWLCDADGIAAAFVHNQQGATKEELALAEAWLKIRERTGCEQIE